MSVAEVRDAITAGMSTEEVLRRVGQPHQRLGSEFVVCAEDRKERERRVTITFDDAGTVARVSS